MNDIVAILLSLCSFVAVVVPIAFVARALQRRLEARSPATLPYCWGFYFGCLAVAGGTLLGAIGGLATVASALAGAWKDVIFNAGVTVFCMVQAVCGWFIIRRKRWAWVIGTILSINPVVWVANAIYGRNRWKEFAGIPYGPARTESEGYELLHVATKLEVEGRVQGALALYQRVVEQCPETAAAHDAQMSIESLRARIG